MYAMTLKQLEAFYWAATCANFAVAAQRLHLSISSLSKRIAELEESLKQPLFDRSGHKAVLTDVGQQLLPKARDLLESATAVRNVFTGREGLSGRCSFGVGELSALTWLPRFIAQAREMHPRLVLEPYVDVGAVLEQKVDKGELDFAVIAGRSSRQTILSQPITQAHFDWMAAPRLAGRAKAMSAPLLSSHPLISLPPGAGTTRIIDDWLLSKGITTEERIFCNNWGAITGMLIEGVYQHADQLIGNASLDDALGTFDDDVLAEILESWFISIRNQAAGTECDEHRWQTGLSFVTSVLNWIGKSIKTDNSIRQIPVSATTAGVIDAYTQNYRGRPRHSFLLSSQTNMALSTEALTKMSGVWNDAFDDRVALLRALPKAH
jgi:DNA-binding transcriptional LysR family regulator